MTNKKRSFYLSSRGFSWFDFRKRGLAIGSTNGLVGGMIIGNIKDMVLEYQNEISGHMRDLPKWVGKGVIVGAQGGEAKVDQIIDSMLANGIKVTGVWIQDWCGKRSHKILGKEQSRLWWNVCHFYKHY